MTPIEEAIRKLIEKWDSQAINTENPDMNERIFGMNLMQLACARQLESLIPALVEMVERAVADAMNNPPEPYRNTEWFKGFEAAHELMECGHSRGDLRDPNYVLGAGGITDCSCVGCQSVAKAVADALAGGK